MFWRIRAVHGYTALPQRASARRTLSAGDLYAGMLTSCPVCVSCLHGSFLAVWAACVAGHSRVERFSGRRWCTRVWLETVPLKHFASGGFG